MKREISSCALPLVVGLSLIAHVGYGINWDGGGSDNKWSTAANWAGDNVPDNNTETGAFVGAANLQIEVDQDFTIQSYTDGFGGPGFDHLLYGGGVLTIDRNAGGFGKGIDNATGTTGGTLRFNGFVTINNSADGLTSVQNSNSAENVTLFDTGSRLRLLTRLQTATGAGGMIHFNGVFGFSSANLIIGSSNVFFGEGHDSTTLFARDVVFNANAKLVVNGGTVLAPEHKFQVNGNGSELEINAAESIAGANVVVGGSNAFLVDLNANQSNLGIINVANGVLTVDVDPSVAILSFLDSSAEIWGSGSIRFEGFREGVIRFGTSASGLTPAQLAVINEGQYHLTPDGYLTALALLAAPDITLEVTPGEAPAITFLTEGSGTYKLQKSEDGLSPESWADVAGQSVAGDLGLKTLVDPAGNPADGQRAFYRVVVN